MRSSFEPACCALGRQPSPKRNQSSIVDANLVNQRLLLPARPLASCSSTSHARCRSILGNEDETLCLQPRGSVCHT